MTDDLEFFENLRALTKTAFYDSPIYQKQIEKKEQLGFSICGNPIQREKGILFGINWGGRGEYAEQSEMPPGDDILTYNFIQRTLPFCEKYLSLKLDETNFNYTNLCFFRTPDISTLSFADYECSYPLFEKYVDYIQPPWIFALGTTSYDILKNLAKLPLTEISELYDRDKKYYGVTGKFLNYNFYAVPHPNARLKAKSRNEIWEQVGKQFTNDMTK